MESQLRTGNPPSDDKHIGVVMGTAHTCLIFVGAQRGAYALESVGCHGHPSSGAAYQDTAGGLTALDPLAQQTRINRIITRDIGRTTNVDHL